MRAFAAISTAILGACTLAACESSSEYDGVSRFAATPYYGPGSPPREDLPEIPGQTDQDAFGGELDDVAPISGNLG
jgi:hypothetical protein